MALMKQSCLWKRGADLLEPIIHKTFKTGSKLNNKFLKIIGLSLLVQIYTEFIENRSVFTFSNKDEADKVPKKKVSIIPNLNSGPESPWTTSRKFNGYFENYSWY